MNKKTNEIFHEKYKLNKDLKILNCDINDFDYVFNQFVLLVKNYEDLNTINIDKVFEWKRNQLKTQIESNYYKIILNNEFAGVFALKDKEDYFELDDFYIVDSFRNMGIGSDILKYLINYTKSENKLLHLCVFKNNIKAIRLYEKLGFKIYNDLGARIMMKVH